MLDTHTQLYDNIMINRIWIYLSFVLLFPIDIRAVGIAQPLQPAFV